MKPVKCMDCEEELNIAELEVGDVAECDICGCEMEVTSLEPPKVKRIDEEK